MKLNVRRANVGASLLVGLAIPVAHAAVYKCADASNIPVYQEMPCAPGKELRNFQTDPPDITVLPGPTGASASRAPPPADTSAKEKPPKNTASPTKSKNGAPARDGTQRKFVHSGMTEAEVRTLLGAPDVTSGGNGKKSMRWMYMPVPDDADTITSLTFADGVVTTVDRRIARK